MIEKVIIRPFDPERDIMGAYQCFKEGFYHTEWPFIEHAKIDFSLDVIRWFYKMSPDSLVAEIDGQVHGLLLGTASTRIRDILKSSCFAILHMLPRLLTNSYKMKVLAYKHVLQVIYGYSPYFFLHPFSRRDGEIMLFTSRTASRSHGMGQKLMDAFIKGVKERGAKGAYVCTDTALSYYFYESYGFAKVREFKMRAYRYSLPEETHKGMLYYLSCED